LLVNGKHRIYVRPCRCDLQFVAATDVVAVGYSVTVCCGPASIMNCLSSANGFPTPLLPIVMIRYVPEVSWLFWTWHVAV
jgi:hypothetical protein